MTTQTGSTKALLDIMAKLRDPESGCPWDLKQNFASIVPHTLEEAYEVAEAIEQENFDELKLELGDLLFQVVFYAQLGQEAGHFNFDDIVAAVSEKLIRRHPHVFGEAVFASDAEIKANWEAEKAKERAQKAQQSSILNDVPEALPAMTRAVKLQKRCANVGFDWPQASQVLDKIEEEIQELRHELNAGTELEIKDELGDLFFAMTNLARKLKCDPEQTLRQANRKFEGRFRQVEQLAQASGTSLEDMTLAQMDALWDEVKRAQKASQQGA